MELRFSGKGQLSELAKTMLQTSQELLKTDGIDAVNKIYAEATYEEREQDYIKQYQLTFSSVNRRCLCRLVGKRCPQTLSRWDPTIHCITFSGMDHVRMFNRHGKPFVFISQPYHFGLDDMKSLIEVCELYSLDANISTRSWHYPDRTVFIEVHKQGWWQELNKETEGNDHE